MTIHTTLRGTVLATALLVSAGFAQTNDDIVCTQQYDPVCGLVQVQCITAPCDPVPETFGNACQLSAQGDRASYFYDGECDSWKTLVAHKIREDLADLSPVEPVLWWTRYAVQILFQDNAMVNVTYEDGHIQNSIRLSYDIKGDTVLLSLRPSPSKELIYRGIISSFLSTYLARFPSNEARENALTNVLTKTELILQNPETTPRVRGIVLIIQDIIENYI